MSILSFNRVRLQARADNMPHKLFSGQGAGVSAGLMAVSTALIGVFIAAAGINVKIVVDGYYSHAVGTQLKIARYQWYTGDVRQAAEALLRAGPTVAEAGLRWQLAQTYFFLARNQQLQGDPIGAGLSCQKALEALDYGQYDHTHNGTSTTFNKCTQFRPEG